MSKYSEAKERKHNPNSENKARPDRRESIQFEAEDFENYGEEALNKVYNHIISILGLDPEELQSSIKSNFFGFSLTPKERLGHAIHGFAYGLSRINARIVKQDKAATIGEVYKTDPNLAIDLIDTLHKIILLNTGNNDVDDLLQGYAEKIINYFTHSTELLEQVSTKHLTSFINESKGDVIKSETFKKNTGVQLGAGVKLTYQPKGTIGESAQKNIKYYIKTHQDFKVRFTTINSALSAEKSIDYRELMIYKILEHTKFGSKSTFCVHPFARAAILIATQAADFTKTHLPHQKKFAEGEKIEETKPSLDEKDVLELNGIDLMARILNITDLNKGNYGRVTVAASAKEGDLESKKESKSSEENIIKNKWKIVDFRINDSREYPSIYSDFLITVNNKTFVQEGGFVERLVKNRETAKKQEIAESLTKRLDDQDASKPNQLSFENAVIQSILDVYNFLDIPETRKYLHLNDDKVRDIKGKLQEYGDIVKGNYMYFKKSVAEKQNEEQKGVASK